VTTEVRAQTAEIVFTNDVDTVEQDKDGSLGWHHIGNCVGIDSHRALWCRWKGPEDGEVRFSVELLGGSGDIVPRLPWLLDFLRVEGTGMTDPAYTLVFKRRAA
jgi:hypothetical protein